MRTKALIVCTGLSIAFGALPHAQRGGASPITAIVGARLIDGTGAPSVESSVVLVSGTQITAAGPRASTQVPAGATIVDAAGKTLIPGLVDVHCHLNQPPDLMKKYMLASLHWGVTTMRITGNDKPENMHVYAEAKAGEFLAPRMYTAGQGFSVSGPYETAPVFRPKTAEEARANVQSLKTQKVDFLKIWMTNPKFPPEIITAIVDEAKKQGIPIVAHVTDTESLHQLADQGVTDFMHEADQAVPPDLIAYAKAKHLSFAPTLANGESGYYYLEHPEFLSMPEAFDGFYVRGRARLLDPAYKQTTLGNPDLPGRKARAKAMLPFVKAMVDNGVRVVTGTDCGAEASQTTPVGHATHRELQLFVDAGLTPLQALKAATLDGARILERTETPTYGAVQAGKAADLVLLDASPEADIYNSNKINKVMRAGKWVP